MLKSIDILLGLSVVMLMVSLVVTVFTQVITNLMETRGRNLRDGISGLLVQIHSDIPADVSRKIAEAILKHPLIKAAGTSLGTVIHREELTALILELAADDGASTGDSTVRDHLCNLLKANGIERPEQTMANVRALTLMLEQAHPELSNNQRFAVAFLQEAPSRFLAKMNGWFDPMIDRVADRFTNSTRLITFIGSFAVALVLQLDTVGLVNRLSVDPELRKALVEQAVALNNKSPETQARSEQQIQGLNAQDRENLTTLASFDVIEFPTNWDDWTGRWTAKTFPLKLTGILLTSMLLSLGAPFWYNALKNLIRLRSLVAQKDDDQRAARQTSTGPPGGDGSGPSPAAVPSLVVGERGDLARVG